MCDLQANKYKSINYIQHFVLRNIDKFVNDSFQIEEPNLLQIECRTHYSIEILQGIANKELIRALNAGDIDSAYDQLETQIGTEEEIVDCVIQNLNSKINKANMTIENKQKLISTLNQQLYSWSIPAVIKIIKLQNNLQIQSMLYKKRLKNIT